MLLTMKQPGLEKRTSSTYRIRYAALATLVSLIAYGTQALAQAQADVDQTLRDFQLPLELDAMPLVESYYQNLPQGNSMKAAGIWQFIPSTASMMGLQVTPESDERIDLNKQNPVAGRLIKSNAVFYNDIGLSILAFNWGDQRVNKLIEKTHSRDSWTLVRAFLNDTYLPKLITAMMIVANPKIVE